MEGMLELLSTTDAAVKALDRTSRSQSSVSSRSSSGSKKKSASEVPDSGIGQTEDRSQKTKASHSRDTDELDISQHSSDVSTTASDVLIRSTTAAPGEKSILDDVTFQSVDNTSNISKCSKYSYGKENFNSSGPVKVKVSSKLLREIKSPYESPREETNTGEESPKVQNVQPEINPSKSKAQSSSIGIRKISTESKASSRGGDTSRSHSGASDVHKPSSRPNSATSKSSTVSQPGSIAKGPTSKSLKDSKTVSQTSVSKPVSNNPKDIITLQSTPQRKQPAQPQKPNTPEKRRKTEGFSQPGFVDRHTPEKVYRDKKILLHEDDDTGSYIEEFCKEEAERQDLVPEKLVTESVETSINSATSSQPEIVTIPERIVTISTRSSVSSDHSLSDSGQILTVQERLVTITGGQPVEDEDSTVSHTKEDDEEEKIPPRLPDKFHQHTKHQSGGLRQGSESSGVSVMEHPSDSDDIHVEKFRLSEKQQLMKENFTKRLQGGPKKRVVQPRLIGPAAKSTKKETKEATIQNTEAITAAVAASAAIAATQPFLKAQQELENKMTSILNQIGSLQSDVAPPLKGDTESERVAQLEKQLAKVTEQRIQHLEKLQEQQVAMQAKLLSLSRTPQNRTEVPRSKSPTIRSPSWSPPVQRKKEFPPKPIIKTTVPKPGHGDYNQEQFRDHRSPETPKPRTNPPKPLSFEFRTKKQPPSTRGILEEILASDASPRRDVPEPTKYEDKDKLRGEGVEKSPAVKRAERLVHDIEEVKDRLQQEVSDGEKALKEQEEKKIQDMKFDVKKIEQLHGPSPLDPYLLPPQKELRSPYKSIPGPGKGEVPFPSSYWDAAQILQQVKENRVTLEANLEAVFRTRQEAEVYALMENLYQEGNNADMLRIRKMVDKKIALLHSQVQREVTDDVILAEVQKKEVPVLMKPTTSGPPKSYTQRATARARVGAKIDTGLSKIKGPSFGPPPSKAVRGKENKPSATTVFKPPTAKQPKIKSVFEDEEYMTKVYGKASYQNKRTTVKDPYLHYQNVPKTKPDRPAGAPDMTTAHLVKSSKTQTSPGIKQFYFSPTHGTYIPVTSAEHAPIPGQLVPMAVPLGGPRIDSGLTYSAPPPPGPLTTSTPSSQPPVSALRNVAVISVPVEDDLRKPPEPELSKQVLPSVDIDTDISETSPIPRSRPRSASPDKPRSLSPEKDTVSLSRASTQHGEVQLRSPQKSPSKSRLEVTFHREEGDEETLTDVSGDLNPEDAPGIALPGYHPPSPPPAEARQPVFPQQRLLDYNAPIVSDVLAEDIRRRDNLEKRAEEWLQQELLAKMISELCPTEEEEEPPPGLPHFVDEDSIQSEVEDKEQSMFVMDSIGRAGMQLFVDVGQPVNTDLVNSLIREVLVEKVVTVLGQRPSDEKEAEQRVVPKLSATIDEDKMGTTEPSPREYLYSPDQIETPQPTPKATPIASPTRVVSPPITPELSPPASPRREPVRVEPPPQPVRLPPQQEAESEASESLDLSEELRILRQKLVVPVTTESVAEMHEIETPVPTPVPEEEPPQEIKPMSPPPPTPRPVESPPKVVEPPPVEVKQVESPKIVQEETIVKKLEVTEETDKTPQPWGNPESPRPEENPEYRNETEPDQPEPMIMHPSESMVTQEDRRSPSPKRQKSPVRQPSPTPSVMESVSESSISDTINQSVSEGQWLLNKSEGEVADFPIDEVTRQRALEKALRLRAEQSMASTLKDTSEIPDESTEFPISEGEFQYNPAIAPEKDPVLLLLSRLQHGPIHPGQLDMTSAQVSDLLDYTGTSGDLSINQLRASVDRSMGEVRPKKHRRQHASPERHYGKYASPERDYGKYDYGRQLRSPSPDQTGRQSPSRGRVSPGYRETSGRKSPGRRQEYDEGGRRSPSRGRASPERGYDGYERPHSRGKDSPHRDRKQRDQQDGRYSPQRDGRYSPQRDGRYSPERDQRDGRYSPERDQQGRRSPLRSSLDNGRKSPMRVSYEMDSEGRDVERYIVEATTTTTKKTTRTPPHGTPSKRTPTRTMTPGGVSLGGSLTSGRKSPVKSALKKPPQATKSPGLPDKSVTMTGPRTYPMPGSDDQRGSQSLSDKGTRAFTPDQMNMEELLQSGYLSQTFSQSSAGRVPSPEHPHRQLSPTRLSRDKKSLGMTYSFESEGGAADSFSESELRRLADSDSLKMSVTLPSMDDSEFL